VRNRGTQREMVRTTSSARRDFTRLSLGRTPGIQKKVVPRCPYMGQVSGTPSPSMDRWMYFPGLGVLCLWVAQALQNESV
jgi:hypothetical protein